MGTRWDHLTELRTDLGGYSAIDGDHATVDKRFVLVEEGTHDEGYYLTSHVSPEDAADYSVTQECPDGWVAQFLVDLDTGERYAATTVVERTTTFDMPTEAIEGPCRYCDDEGPHEGMCCEECFDLIDGSWQLPLAWLRALVAESTSDTPATVDQP